MSEEVLGDRAIKNKIPFWSASIILWVIEITEMCFGGSRLVSYVPFVLFSWIYIALYS